MPAEISTQTCTRRRVHLNVDLARAPASLEGARRGDYARAAY